ncbi:hypothetical protein ACJMK2_005053 [Sinanodonta woodiana]|uniref:C2H2-type domain-containing protein n=1 Tax=Sinanodonta woodiana TaxID=1069815 RepID=A0ABD3VRH8_SINWO
MGCRKRKAVSLPDSPVKLTNKDYYETGYNPNNHIRRRESTELLDTHQCSGCGVKFMTILLLERHVKICAKKEKFKDLHPLKSWKSPLLEISTHASNVSIKIKSDKELQTENEKEKDDSCPEIQYKDKRKETKGTESHALKIRHEWPKEVKRKNK